MSNLVPPNYFQDLVKAIELKDYCDQNLASATQQRSGVFPIIANLLLDFSQIEDLVNVYVNSIWDKEFMKSKTGKEYRNMVGGVQHKWAEINPNSALQRTWGRIRMLNCCLNHYQHKIGKHPTGLCDDCNVPESIQHVIY